MPCSHAPSGFVRPLQLDAVGAELLCLPGADVADLAIAVVIPTLAWDRVRDRFTELVRSGRCDRVEHGQPAAAAGAVGIWHDRVKDLAIDVVVVAAEGRA